MDERRVARVLAQQDQVISRRQVLDCEGDDHDIARLVRQRRLSPVHPGVYVGHTGPLTVSQREWAAVLRYWPAALTGTSALRRYGLPTSPDPDGAVQVAVAVHRRVDPPPSILVTRLTRFDEDNLDNFSPPRIRLEQAVLDCASASKTEAGAVAVLSDAVRSRRTTPTRLRTALAMRPRLRHRRLVAAILDDVGAGAHSVLERAYLTQVERPHAFPSGSRQRRVRAGRAPSYRDVEYLTTRTIIELDGRLGHELATDQWDDLDRDLASAVGGAWTIRLGWGQVLEPCRVAWGVAQVLIARGWGDGPRPCSPTCVVPDDRGVPPSPGE